MIRSFSSIALVFVLAVSACKTSEETLRDVPRNSAAVLSALGDIEDKALVLYSHGADRDTDVENCGDPRFAVPAVLANLNGQQAGDLAIAVVKYCYATRQATFNARSGTGETRSTVRNRELKGVLADLEHAGMARDRILLAGHSAGGWNSLLYLAENPGGVAGVIALSPASGGPAASRTAHARARWDDELGRIKSADQLPALVYWVEGDAYMHSSSQLEFLRRLPGADLRLIPSTSEIGGVRCSQANPHTVVFDACFSQTQREQVASFVRARLPAGNTRGRPAN